MFHSKNLQHIYQFTALAGPDNVQVLAQILTHNKKSLFKVEFGNYSYIGMLNDNRNFDYRIK